MHFLLQQNTFFRHDKAKNSIRGTLNLKRSQITVASGSVRFYLPPESHHIATPSYLCCMCGCVSAVCFKRNLTHPSCEAQTSVQDAFLKKGQTRQEGFKTYCSKNAICTKGHKKNSKNHSCGFMSCHVTH